MDDLVAVWERAEEARLEREQSEGARQAQRLAEAWVPDCVPVSPDPDVALAGGSDMPTLSMDPDHYPVGTWFYYGDKQVGFRLPGEATVWRKDR